MDLTYAPLAALVIPLIYFYFIWTSTPPTYGSHSNPVLYDQDKSSPSGSYTLVPGVHADAGPAIAEVNQSVFVDEDTPSLMNVQHLMMKRSEEAPNGSTQIANKSSRSEVLQPLARYKQNLRKRQDKLTVVIRSMELSNISISRKERAIDEGRDLAFLMRAESPRNRAKIAEMLATGRYKKGWRFNDPVVSPRKRGWFAMQRNRMLERLRRLRVGSTKKVGRGKGPERNKLTTELFELRQRIKQAEEAMAEAAEDVNAANTKHTANVAKGGDILQSLLEKGKAEQNLQLMTDKVADLKRQYEITYRGISAGRRPKLRGVISISATWSLWGSWSRCSVTCGQNGITVRRRDCETFPDIPCPGTALDVRSCSSRLKCKAKIKRRRHARNADLSSQQLQQATKTGRVKRGVFHDWGDWGPCSVTCGKGFRARSRVCYTSRQMDTRCTGPSTMIEKCRMAKCGQPTAAPPHPPMPVGGQPVVYVMSGQNGYYPQPNQYGPMYGAAFAPVLMVPGGVPPPPVPPPPPPPPGFKPGETGELSKVTVLESGGASGPYVITHHEKPKNKEETRFPAETIVFIVLFIVCLLLFIIAFCVYFYQRRKENETLRKLKEAQPFYKSDGDEDGRRRPGQGMVKSIKKDSAPGQGQDGATNTQTPGATSGDLTQAPPSQGISEPPSIFDTPKEPTEMNLQVKPEAANPEPDQSQVLASEVVKADEKSSRRGSKRDSKSSSPKKRPSITNSPKVKAESPKSKTPSPKAVIAPSSKTVTKAKPPKSKKAASKAKQSKQAEEAGRKSTQASRQGSITNTPRKRSSQVRFQDIEAVQPSSGQASPAGARKSSLKGSDKADAMSLEQMNEGALSLKDSDKADPMSLNQLGKEPEEFSRSSTSAPTPGIFDGPLSESDATGTPGDSSVLSTSMGSPEELKQENKQKKETVTTTPEDSSILPTEGSSSEDPSKVNNKEKKKKPRKKKTKEKESKNMNANMAALVRENITRSNLSSIHDRQHQITFRRGVKNSTQDFPQLGAKQDFPHLSAKQEFLQLRSKQKIPQLSPKQKIPQLRSKQEIPQLSSKQEFPKFSSKQKFSQHRSKQEFPQLCFKQESPQLSSEHVHQCEGNSSDNSQLFGAFRVNNVLVKLSSASDQVCPTLELREIQSPAQMEHTKKSEQVLAQDLLLKYKQLNVEAAKLISYDAEPAGSQVGKSGELTPANKYGHLRERGGVVSSLCRERNDLTGCHVEREGISDSPIQSGHGRISHDVAPAHNDNFSISRFSEAEVSNTSQIVELRYVSTMLTQNSSQAEVPIGTAQHGTEDVADCNLKVSTKEESPLQKEVADQFLYQGKQFEENASHPVRVESLNSADPASSQSEEKSSRSVSNSSSWLSSLLTQSDRTLNQIDRDIKKALWEECHILDTSSPLPAARNQANHQVALNEALADNFISQLPLANKDVTASKNGARSPFIETSQAAVVVGDELVTQRHIFDVHENSLCSKTVEDEDFDLITAMQDLRGQNECKEENAPETGTHNMESYDKKKEEILRLFHPFSLQLGWGPRVSCSQPVELKHGLVQVTTGLKESYLSTRLAAGSSCEQTPFTRKNAAWGMHQVAKAFAGRSGLFEEPVTAENSPHRAKPLDKNISLRDSFSLTSESNQILDEVWCLARNQILETSMSALCGSYISNSQECKTKESNTYVEEKKTSLGNTGTDWSEKLNRRNSIFNSGSDNTLHDIQSGLSTLPGSPRSHDRQINQPARDGTLDFSHTDSHHANSISENVREATSQSSSRWLVDRKSEGLNVHEHSDQDLAWGDLKDAKSCTSATPESNTIQVCPTSVADNDTAQNIRAPFKPPCATPEFTSCKSKETAGFMGYSSDNLNIFLVSEDNENFTRSKQNDMSSALRIWEKNYPHDNSSYLDRTKTEETSAYIDSTMTDDNNCQTPTVRAENYAQILNEQLQSFIESTSWLSTKDPSKILINWDLTKGSKQKQWQMFQTGRLTESFHSATPSQDMSLCEHADLKHALFQDSFVYQTGSERQARPVHDRLCQRSGRMDLVLPAHGRNSESGVEASPVLKPGRLETEPALSDCPRITELSASAESWGHGWKVNKDSTSNIDKDHSTNMNTDHYKNLKKEHNTKINKNPAINMNKDHSSNMNDKDNSSNMNDKDHEPNMNKDETTCRGKDKTSTVDKDWYSACSDLSFSPEPQQSQVQRTGMMKLTGNQEPRSLASDRDQFCTPQSQVSWKTAATFRSQYASTSPSDIGDNWHEWDKFESMHSCTTDGTAESSNIQSLEHRVVTFKTQTSFNVDNSRGVNKPVLKKSISEAKREDDKRVSYSGVVLSKASVSSLSPTNAEADCGLWGQKIAEETLTLTKSPEDSSPSLLTHDSEHPVLDGSGDQSSLNQSSYSYNGPPTEDDSNLFHRSVDGRDVTITSKLNVTYTVSQSDSVLNYNRVKVSPRMATSLTTICLGRTYSLRDSTTQYSTACKDSTLQPPPCNSTTAGIRFSTCRMLESDATCSDSYAAMPCLNSDDLVEDTSSQGNTSFPLNVSQNRNFLKMKPPTPLKDSKLPAQSCTFIKSDITAAFYKQAIRWSPLEETVLSLQTTSESELSS